LDRPAAHGIGKMLVIKYLLPVWVLLGASGCVTTPDVEVFVTAFKPMPSTLLEQRVRLDLRVQNLSERELNITGLDLHLRVNNRRLARGVSNQQVSIPRLSEGKLSVVVSSSLFDSIRQLLAVPETERFQYSLAGKVFTSGLTRRFRRAGEIERGDLQAFTSP
ncbi:MAG: LEA type 2 family protein, partial [Pseudomonadota bacterium]